MAAQCSQCGKAAKHAADCPAVDRRTYVLSYISRVTCEERVLKIGSGDAMARRFDMNACRPGETWLVRASDGRIVMWKGTMPWELREDDPFEGLS